MEIVVCMKHVPDTTEIRLVPGGGFDLSGVPGKINDYDKNALEEAVRQKEKHGGRITILTVGPGEAAKTLKEALAMGADRAVLIRARALEQSDAVVTARVLSRAVQTIGPCDLVLCGEVSEDSHTGLVGPSVAEWLGFPHASSVISLSVENGRAVCECRWESEIESVAIPLPTVLSVTRELNRPRVPTLLQTLRVPRDRVAEWGLNDLGLSEGEVGCSGSGTEVVGLAVPVVHRKNLLLEGDPRLAAGELIRRLREEGVI